MRRRFCVEVDQPEGDRVSIGLVLWQGNQNETSLARDISIIEQGKFRGPRNSSGRRLYVDNLAGVNRRITKGIDNKSDCMN